MKKSIAIFAVLALATSCIEDSRNNNMVDDSLSLVYDEVVVPVSVYAGSQKVTVLKSGKGAKAATATLAVSPEAMEKYNTAEETAFKALQAHYSFSGTTVSFQPSEATKSVSLTWDPADVSKVITDGNNVIPVVISEKSDGIEINENRNLVLLNILNSTVSLASSGSTVVAKEVATEDGEVSVKIGLDNAMPKDLNVKLAVDNSLVSAYNAEKGTSYIAVPDGYVQIPSEGATITAGSSDVFCNLTLKTSALFQPNGKMMDFRTLVVPIKISSTDEAGVIIADKVYYLLVNSPFAGAGISRIWGRYSASGYWAAAYGLPSGADRNLALDQNWVYLPYAVGGTVAKITAISVNDPENKREVNTTGFVNGTITTACVRTIDKGDGSRMLVASGAAENNFTFYAWENGIDNPPTVFTLECTWRRGGDRFEYHGTWKDGVLYVHAYQGRFATRYKVENGAFVSTDDGKFNGTKRALVNMTATDTGFGGFYQYPGQDQMIFTTSDVSAFITMLNSYVDPGDGQKAWETAREEFPGADMTWGYRTFTYRGEKYIAYTAIDKDDDLKEDGITTYTTKQRARLVVVRDKGSFKASLLGDNKDIFFEAPLQGEKFEDIAVAPPASAQGDCAVVVLDDKVLIAAGVQGIGLSVFKME